MVIYLQFCSYWIIDFSKVQNSIFIAQEISRYFSLKNIYSLSKNDWFCAFCVYKNIFKNNIFVYKWK